MKTVIKIEVETGKIFGEKERKRLSSFFSPKPYPSPPVKTTNSIGCNMRDTMKKAAFLVGIILIVVGLVIFNFFISFGYGSFWGFLSELRNPPSEKKLESLRSDAIEQLSQSHTELGSLTGLTLYEKTYSDMCAKGEHGWKREDSYAYVCSYRLTYYYGTDREYKELLLDLEKTLSELGWNPENRTPKRPTISEAIGGYTGDIFLAELPIYVQKMPDGHTIKLRINTFNGYDRDWIRSSREEPDPFGFGIGINQEIYKDASDRSPEEIFNEITSSGQEAIMIAISREYFRN
jgi:hypothetical protein